MHDRSADSATCDSDVLACGVHVADIVALILDFEAQDRHLGVDDIAATFGITTADVSEALSQYARSLDRLRPIVHARRRLGDDLI